VFGVCRLVFLLYFYSDLEAPKIELLIGSLTHALPLDVSAASYILMFPVLLIALGNFFKPPELSFVTAFYILSISVAYVLLSISEIAVYAELHQKIYYSLFAHIFEPGEVQRFITPSLLSGFLIAVTVLFILLGYVYKRVGTERKYITYKLSWSTLMQNIFFVGISAGVLVIGCRGGLQPIPINEGVVCFSKNQIANDAAVNSFWNLGHSYVETQNLFVSNQYLKMSSEEALSIFDSLYKVEVDTTVSIINSSSPNVCLIILEGWHSDVIKSLGGYDNIAPNFEQLITDGYLFNNFYSTGHISDQGVAGILSGFPALTLGSVINQTEKQYSLPCLGKTFKEQNYHTSFFYGGQLEYGGIKKFVYHNKFDVIAEQSDFDKLPKGKLGVHDSLMMKVWIDSIGKFTAPFFSCLYTISTHTPYDMDTYSPINFGGDERDYLNSIAYADRQLGKFFTDAKTKSWYSNTLFIIVSDHGHHTPNNYEYDSKEHYHIPMLICGGALKDELRGKTNEMFGTQTDIANTLLRQLKFDDANYKWGKNLMNPYSNSFAFYTFNDGYGYLEPNCEVRWNKRYQGRDINTAATEEEKQLQKKKGDAYLQVLMQMFLEM
jgi:phosphoglycerol transferase MdoB-like AlkP superfamily enzyme